VSVRVSVCVRACVRARAWRVVYFAREKSNACTAKRKEAKGEERGETTRRANGRERKRAISVSAARQNIFSWSANEISERSVDRQRGVIFIG